jgi:hypothetical protein
MSMTLRRAPPFTLACWIVSRSIPYQIFAMFELSPNVRLGLWARHDVQPAPRGANDAGELAMAVGTADEVEALCADQKRKGVTILQEPVTMDFGRTFLAADLDGHRLRVFCPS